MPLTDLDPRVALVVIDLQNGTVGRPGLGPLPGPEVVANTAQLAAAFRAAGKPVVLVTNTSLTGPDAPPGRTEFGSGGGELPAGFEDLVAELDGHPEDLRVTKRTWGAFHGTDLDLRLRRRGVTQVVLAGVATSIGVDTSAREAYAHGYSVVIASDAVTDVNPDAHALTTSWVFRILGQQATTAEIRSLVAEGGS
ncbi:isochorismatase family protein [Cryptosporangium aurantiacum]|uniref:Nicotinamidase-related amidase n=1 Tax=Cryptosporangium aurantiacum TaxID=134849 RepID=A0A1M7RB60_9ACTN|nr:isochorismatase family protein [Cryptosporangium aurantiacum]SHN43555.1 Nicotinamidase-related amidase [Cryptosporangium aurantiacum]